MLTAFSAQAQSPADFYKGKSVNVLIGVGVGGFYDLNARVVARHIGRHIPGAPQLVPQNMTGAGGARMVAYLADVAANKALRRSVQVVFQDPFSSLSPRMTVEEIVGEGLRVHQPELSVAQRQLRVVQALADVGMSQAQFPRLLQRYPHEFSGGQRQRLALARALMVEPDMLVLDEPTSALDVTVQKQVLQLLQRLQRERGLSYLLITHDVAVIRAMAHQILVMKGGQILESGPAAQVLAAPQHPYTQLLVGQLS
jgi:microcin C transport system ATP-binding protein